MITLPVHSTNNNISGLSTSWCEARFFFILAAFAVLILSSYAITAVFFPSAVMVDLTKYESTTISMTGPGFSFQYIPFLFILGLLVCAWLIPSWFQPLLGHHGSQIATRSIFDRTRLHSLFNDSLTFTPFLVFLPFILFQSQAARIPGEPLLAWSLIAHVLWRIWFYSSDCESTSPRPAFQTLRFRFEQLSSRVIWLLLVLVFAMIYGLLAMSYGTSLIGLEGDEPEYVMVAHSLLVDGDLMVRNNYERLEYRIFLRHQLPFGRTTWEGYPVEGIALSLYLVPFYWLVLHFPAYYLIILRLAVVPLAALLMGELFLLLTMVCRHRFLSFGMVMIGGLVSPLLFYVPLIFSEIMGALFLTCTLRSLYMMNEAKGSGIGAVFCMNLLLWTGAKYVTLVFPLVLWFMFLVIRLWLKGSSRTKKHLVYSIVLFLVLTGLYLTFLRTFYHSFSPLATRGGELLEFTRTEGAGIGDSLDWLIGDRISRLPLSFRVAFGNFLDQRVGLLFYSPFYILLFSGVIIVIRRKEYIFFPPLLLFALYWFMLFWLSYWEGYGPPSRYAIPLIPLFLLFIARGLLSSASGTYLLVPLSSLSLFVTITAIQAPELLYHHTLWRFGDEVNNFLTNYSGRLVPLPDLFPSFTAFPFPWGSFTVVLVLVFLVISISLGKGFTSFSRFLLGHNLLWTIIPLIFLTITFVDRAPLMTGDTLRNYGPIRTKISKSSQGTYHWENNGFWSKTRRWAAVSIESDCAGSDRLTFSVHSLIENEVIFRSGLREIRLVIPKIAKKRVNIRDMTTLDLNGRKLLFFQIRSESGRNPFYHDRGDDGRELGAFFTIIKVCDQLVVAAP